MIDEHVVRAAVGAVETAGVMTARAQGRLAAGDTLTKSDDSPVTVADFAAQAIVCRLLAERLGDVVVVGEEHPDDLAADDRLLGAVAELVAEALGRPDLEPDAVVESIAIGGGTAAPGTGTYWTLDPIDGTKGFLRGDQYATALALIDRGEVVLGVLGCPNLPNADGSRGALFVAANGATTMRTTSSPDPQPVRFAEPSALARWRFCEYVVAAHSDHD